MVPTLTTFIQDDNMILEVLTRENRQDREIKGIQFRKERKMSFFFNRWCDLIYRKS